MASKKGKRENNFSSERKAAVSRSRSARRQAHFESGAPLSEWTPGTKIHKNKADKRQTRRTRKQSAIKDSQEG